MKRSAAHDFNNIFSTILANCEMLQDELSGNKSALERILLSCEQGFDLVQKHRTLDMDIPVEAAAIKKSGPLNAAKILVLDDEVTFVKLISRWIGNSLTTVYGFSEGRAAIQFFRENSDGIDAVITDLNMPNLSGVEVCNALKQIQKNIPIIITSGHGKHDARQKILEIGAAEYLSKPFSQQTLTGALERTLSS